MNGELLLAGALMLWDMGSASYRVRNVAAR